jgi:hypothetical protein
VAEELRRSELQRTKLISLSLPLPLCFDVKEIVKRKIVKREEKLDRNFIWFG